MCHPLQAEGAKFLPSISYDSELLKGKEVLTVNNLQSSLFKKLFSIPRYVSQAQIRLEFGLFHQGPYRKGAPVKLCWRTRAAEANSLAHLRWVETERQALTKNSVCSVLQVSVIKLNLKEAWHISMDYTTFKCIANKAVKLSFFTKDKAAIATKNYAWAILPLHET